MMGNRRVRRDRGAAAVEFTLIFLFLALPLIFATMSYAFMFSFRQALSQATAEGARAAVGAPDAATAATAAKTAVSNALTNYHLDCGATSKLTCTVTPASGSPVKCGPSDTHDCVTVTLTYPYRANPFGMNLPPLGFVLPSNLSFTSIVEVD